MEYSYNASLFGSRNWPNDINVIFNSETDNSLACLVSDDYNTIIFPKQIVFVSTIITRK